MCTLPCTYGFRTAHQRGKAPCCFDCIPCPDGEIANGTNMENCLRCPEDKWSNFLKDDCIERTKDFLSYGDILGVTSSCIAFIFVVITAAVLFVFVKFRRSPIVRANDRNLSYILLVSIMLSFLCSFLFIGYPVELTCMLRQAAFGFIFTVAVSAVLGKTVTVIIAFNATKPNSTFRKWIGTRISIGLVLFFSLGELFICIIWLICSPPFVDTDTKTIPGTIIIQCNEGSFAAFYVVISYIGLLALFSFIVAFLVRKLPDRFNDAQYITFSMLVFCSVWISFIPIYLSSKGKYVVAVEIFTILSSTGGLLLCIFAPKCYIILVKPELNSIRKKRNRLNYYLKNIHLKMASGEDFFFTKDGNIPGKFDILNWIIDKNGAVNKIHVGRFLPNTDQLIINETAIAWGPYFGKLSRYLDHNMLQQDWVDKEKPKNSFLVTGEFSGNGHCE
ncbi:vomeronasal type-2 receptor 26 [Xenopus tropicalis]|uniref:Vomeronasal type-2 receptor 26 n=1 Tax=Xenopus tropicalis TaxID=8364 RepID=A0A8J1IPX2_XENTR|nr:vomeronasal type-2 receptor 26 [Xenopus tropicalis]